MPDENSSLLGKNQNQSTAEGEEEDEFINEPAFDCNTEFWLLFHMAWQVSLATVTRMCLTSIDSAFLGHIDTKYLAASSLATTWTGIVQTAVWGGTSALLTLCGQAWGANNPRLTALWLQIGLIITFFASFFVTLWYWAVDVLIRYSSPDKEVVEAGIEFARVLSFNATPALIYACLRQYFQSLGIMWPITVCGIVGVILTTVFNQLFIYGWGEWKGIGFLGSPLATVCASYCQPILLLIICVHWKKYHLNAWFGWDFEGMTKDRIIQFFKMAIPISLNSLVSTLANSSLSLLAAKMGSDVIAANALLSGIWTIMWALSYGFGCATQVFVANYMGCGRPKAAFGIFKIGLTGGMVVVVLTVTVISIFPKKVFGIYSNDPNIINQCIDVTSYFLVAIALSLVENMIASALTGMGRPKLAFYVSFIGTWFIQIPLAYFLGFKANMGLKALWIPMLVMEMFKFVAFTVIIFTIDWKAHSIEVMRLMQVKKAILEESDISLLSEDEFTPPPQAGELPPKQSISRQSSMLLLKPSNLLRGTSGTNLIQ